MKHLTSLDMAYTNITDLGVKMLAERLSTILIELDIGGCRNVTDECCRHIKMCTHLKYLSLSNCSINDNALVAIVNRCRNLEVLNCYNCPVTSISLAAIYQHLHRMKNLNLSRCTIDHNIGGTTGYQDMEKLIQLHTPLHLRIIDLSKCRTLCNEDLKILALFKYLENVDISGCREVTNSGIEILSSGLGTSLRVLKIAYCRKCSNDSLKSLQTYCFNLNELDISDCPKITDGGLMAIAGNLCHLNAITIFDCSNILSNVADMQAELRKNFNKNLTIYM